MIEVKNLSKHYGDKKAVDNISFTVEDGVILGFLGPNGAGKSTTMNMLTGYISATGGQALINGVDVFENPIKAKEQIGYLPEIPPLYVDMTVREYLDFVFDLKKCKLPREKHIKQVCGVVKITDVYDRIIKNLSKGYKQRVGLAQALIGNPPILILDEPTVGLDPHQIIEIRDLIKKLGKEHTVILSSHILSEIQAVCDKIIIINKGQVAANDTAENIANAIAADNKFSVRIEGPKDKVMDEIDGIAGVVKIIPSAEREKDIYDYEVETDGTDIRRMLFNTVVENNWTMLGLKSSELTLEDIFLKITMGEGIKIPPRKAPEKKEEKSGEEKASEKKEDSAPADNKGKNNKNKKKKSGGGK